MWSRCHCKTKKKKTKTKTKNKKKTKKKKKKQLLLSHYNILKEFATSVHVIGNGILAGKYLAEYRDLLK